MTDLTNPNPNMPGETVNTEAATIAIPDDVDRTELSPEEEARVQKLVPTIDISDDTCIDTYASDALEDVRKTAGVDIGKTRIKDVESLGKIIIGIDSKMGEFKLWAKARKIYSDIKKEFKIMQKKFQPILDYVNEQEQVLDRHILRLSKEKYLCEDRRKAVESCRRDVLMYIKAGRIALEAARSGKLAQLDQKSQETGSNEDKQARDRFKSQCDTFELKLFNLEQIRTNLFLRGPAIEQEKESNRTMESTLTTHRDLGIPLLMDVMASLVNGSFVRQSIALADKSRNTLSEMMKLAADVTGQNAVDAEKAKGKGAFDLEALIYSIDKYVEYTQQVQEAADENLRNARETLPRLQELEKKVAEASRTAKI